MDTRQFSKSITCACFLMLGVALDAQTLDPAKGWERLRLAQPQPLNATPAVTTTPLEQARPWPPTSILGTWHLTGTFFGAPYETLMTFLPSDTNDQGSVIFTSNQDQGPPFSGTAGTGNWTRVGPYSFIATHLTFLFDVANSVPFGVLKIVDSITIQGNQIKVKSALTFPGYPPVSGVETTGSRVPIEAPPAN